MTSSDSPLPPLLNPHADRVRAVAKLAKRAARNKSRQFLAEGPQVVREALRAHREELAAGAPGVVHQLFATEACLNQYPELAELAEGVAAIRLASEAVLAAMASTVSPQGVLAVCNFVDVPLGAVLDGGPRLIAGLCQVQDPGNAGTILRAADSAGADAVVFSHGSVDLYNPKTVRSTVGSLFHLPVVTGVESADFITDHRQAGVGVLAADGYGALDLDMLQDESAARSFEQSTPEAAYELERPTLWLFGNEANGLSNEELALADARVAVPVYGQAESLNVSTAATVCLYASTRAQRRSEFR